MPNDQPAGVQLLHSLIYLARDHWIQEVGWGSTLTLPDILVTAQKIGFEQGISGIFPFKKSQVGSVFPRLLFHQRWNIE